ncbi:MAG: FemAB family XrtA/PEP-CTERM system-associated protein [Parvularculaceae bacterium]
MNAVTPIRAAVDVALADGSEARAWDAYVDAAPEAGFFHRWGWGEVARAAYGHEPVRLVAREEGGITGVLPLVDVKSPLLGRALISSAFTVGGGVAADNAHAAAALADASIEQGRRLGARYVELRGAHAAFPFWKTKKGVYAGFCKAIPEDEAENLAMIPRKRRAEIRKALAAAESGALRVRYDGEADAFYALYARSMRDHGTPVFPKRYLREILRHFRNETEIAVVDHEGEPVAALVSFYFRDRVMPYYAGAAPAARKTRALDYLYWMQMRRAVTRGARLFDFGRSKYGSGAFDYKTYWGFEPVALEYQYALLDARETPNVNPDNPKFSMAARVWRRLPLPLANALGPLAACNFA